MTPREEAERIARDLVLDINADWTHDGMNHNADRDREETVRAITDALLRERAMGMRAAAEIARRHVPSSPSAAGEYMMRHNGEDIAFAIEHRARETEGPVSDPGKVQGRE